MQRLGIDAGRFGSFFERLTGVDRRLGAGVGFPVVLQNRHIVRLLIADHEGPVIRRHARDIARHLHIGLTFIGKANALAIDADAVVDNVERVGAGRPVNRTAVELVDVDNFRQEGCREHNVFARDDARAANRHLRAGRTNVLRDECLIGREAARCEHNAVLRIDFRHNALGLYLGAGDAARLRVGNELDHLGARAHFNAHGLGLIEERHDELCSARLQFAGDEVGAIKLRPHQFVAGQEVDAAEAVEPFEKTRAVVNDGMRQSGHCFLLRHLHHVVIERFGRIGRDILGFLEARVKTEQEASGIDGIARRHRHLFEQERLQAKFCCMNGTDQPAAAGTDNNEVVFGGFARFGFGSSHAAQHTRRSYCSDGCSFEELTTICGHFSPFLWSWPSALSLWKRGLRRRPLFDKKDHRSVGCSE